MNSTKPVDNRLSIQTPKTQFITSGNQQHHNILSQQSQTQAHSSQQKPSFNFNFGKVNQKLSHYQEKTFQPPSTQSAQTQSQVQQQNIQHDNGYKSFIQIANKKDSPHQSRTTNTSPIVKKEICNEQPTGGALSGQINRTQPQSQNQQHPQQYISNHQVLKSQQQPQIGPTQSAKISPIRNISPGEKIVIKKSEIKFKPSPPREHQAPIEAYQQPINLENKRGSIGNSPVVGKSEKDKENSQTRPSDLLQQGKQLAFDFIKSMLNIGQTQNSSQKQDNRDDGVTGGILKKKFLKFGNPGPNHKTLKKQNINFANDMKKHGIIKDIDSVKAMKFYLENSPNPSENNSLLDQSQQNSPIDLSNINPLEQLNIKKQQEKDLKIETNFIDVDQNNIEKKVSPSNENNYIFPFQRRARSHSPPKDSSLGQNNSQHSQGSINNESPPGGITINHFKMQNDKGMQNQNHQQNSKSKGHQRVNSGPIIPDRNIESVIKHTPGIFFGMGPHLGNHLEQLKNEEMEKKILQGKEVDEWLSPIEETKNNAVNEDKKRFSQLGFIGDADDVDDDDFEEQDDSDEWMFQTFEKKNKNMPQRPVVQKLNQGNGAQLGRIEDFENDDFLIPEDEDLCLEENNPSINQLGTETAGIGYQNMLDKWLNKMQ